MSRQLVSRSADLQRLEEEGYSLAFRSEPSYLMVKLPYANAAGEVAMGMLVSELSVAGETTAAPSTHEIYFVGADPQDLPCDQHGRPLDELINQRGTLTLAADLVASCSFSHKPNPTYQNYYEKMATYSDMVVAYAQAIKPEATAKMFLPIETDETESVFRYVDSATSRAEIGAVAEKLRRLAKIVIIGLGGTGGYIFDAVAKTPVGRIDLYDGDAFETHTAFRAPGATTLDELNERPYKVDYYKSKYDAIRRSIFAHPEFVDVKNIDEIRDADFVFVAIEGDDEKRFVLEKLEEFGIPFVDVGMGVSRVGDALGGIIRTTTGLPGHMSHVWSDLSFTDDEANNEYEKNIQIADLNMLNAALAVIRWKKLFGFYLDFDQELSSAYTIDGNHLLNEHKLSEAEVTKANSDTAQRAEKAA